MSIELLKAAARSGLRRRAAHTSLALAVCALASSAWQSARADDTTLPNILVTGDTQHLPQSFRKAAGPVRWPR